MQVTEIVCAPSLILVKLTDVVEVKLEEDVSQKWMYGMRKDIDTLDKRFPNVTSVSKNAYKHIQANRLRQFEVGSNRAYKYIIQC